MAIEHVCKAVVFLKSQRIALVDLEGCVYEYCLNGPRQSEVYELTRLVARRLKENPEEGLAGRPGLLIDAQRLCETLRRVRALLDEDDLRRAAQRLYQRWKGSSPRIKRVFVGEAEIEERAAWLWRSMLVAQKERMDYRVGFNVASVESIRFDRRILKRYRRASPSQKGAGMIEATLSGADPFVAHVMNGLSEKFFPYASRAPDESRTAQLCGPRGPLQGLPYAWGLRNDAESITGFIDGGVGFGNVRCRLRYS